MVESAGLVCSMRQALVTAHRGAMRQSSASRDELLVHVFEGTLAAFAGANVPVALSKKGQAMSLKIERISIGEINPAPYNPRKDLRPHDPEYKRLVRSISEFGLVEPLVWNRRSGNLVGGHQRFKVLVARGAKRVEVSVVDLNPQREKALNVALNRVSGLWDERKLAELLDDLLAAPEIDVEVTGFELPDVQSLIAGLPIGRSESPEDDFDVGEDLASHEDVITKPGEVIRLGEHRLLCGDATDKAQVGRILKGKPVDVVFTDPPYNVGYTGRRPTGKRGTGRSKVRPRRAVPKGPPPMRHDRMDPDRYAEWLGRALAAMLEPLRPGGAFYVWNSAKNLALLHQQLSLANCHVSTVITWAKERFALGYGDYNQQTEFCVYGWAKPGSGGGDAEGGHCWYGPTTESTLWRVAREPVGIYEHPTQKPVELAARALRNSSLPGDRVLDPFLGSGTTLIAAARQGRRCLGIEIEPRYCDVIVRRFIALAGADAVSRAVAKRYAARNKKGAAA